MKTVSYIFAIILTIMCLCGSIFNGSDHLTFSKKAKGVHASIFFSVSNDLSQDDPCFDADDIDPIEPSRRSFTDQFFLPSSYTFYIPVTHSRRQIILKNYNVKSFSPVTSAQLRI